MFLLLLHIVSGMQISLIPGGHQDPDKIKSNLINAYTRFLRHEDFTFYVDGVKRFKSSDNVIQKITNLNLFRNRTLCVDWKIESLVENAYILTDLDPCEPEETVRKAQEFIRKRHTITTFGMGSGIKEEWLSRVCGPWKIKGLNWFSV